MLSLSCRAGSKGPHTRVIFSLVWPGSGKSSTETVSVCTCMDLSIQIRKSTGLFSRNDGEKLVEIKLNPLIPREVP